MIKAMAGYYDDFYDIYTLLVSRDNDDGMCIYNYQRSTTKKWTRFAKGSVGSRPDGVAAFPNRGADAGNLEWLTVENAELRHWWFDNSGKVPWWQNYQKGPVIGRANGGVAAFQNRTPGMPNYEVFAVKDGELCHWWRDCGSGEWCGGDSIGRATGGVAAFQNRAPNNSNFEVFAVNGSTLRHWWRDTRTGEWHGGTSIGQATGGVGAFQNSAQNNLNYELFAVNNGNLCHWWRDDTTGRWYGGESLGQADGPLAAFQSPDAKRPDYEVYAAQGGFVHHWSRNWSTGRWSSAAVYADGAPF